MCWKLRLDAPEQIAFNLSQWFRTADVEIEQLSWGEGEQGYFLQSQHLQGISDVNELSSRVFTLLALLNGSIALYWGYERYDQLGPVKLRQAYRAELAEAEFPSAWQACLLSQVQARTYPFEQVQHQRNPFANSCTAYLHLAVVHPDLLLLLNVIGQKLDWTSLLKQWRCLLAIVGGEEALLSQLKLDRNRAAHWMRANMLWEQQEQLACDYLQQHLGYQRGIQFIENSVHRYLRSRYNLAQLKMQWLQANR